LAADLCSFQARKETAVVRADGVARQQKSSQRPQGAPPGGGMESHSVRARRVAPQQILFSQETQDHPQGVRFQRLEVLDADPRAVCQAANSRGHRLLILIGTDTGLLPFPLRRGEFGGEISVGFGMLEVVKGGRQAAVHVDFPVERVQMSLDGVF
jgi:hypothetical protein